MRTLIAQQPKPTKPASNASSSDAQKKSSVSERDACTMAALRAAGVVGYQGNAEEEAALSVALADAEFFAKQALSAGSGPAQAAGPRTPKPDMFDAVPSAMASNEPETIDMEELEDASGYGKK